jgi:hypothetical protein
MTTTLNAKRLRELLDYVRTSVLYEIVPPKTGRRLSVAPREVKVG